MAMTKEARKRARDEKLAKGLCGYEGCHEPRDGTKKQCRKHLDQAAASMRKSNGEAGKRGLCPRCKDEPAVEGKKYGLKCLAYCAAKTAAARKKDPSKQQAISARHYAKKITRGKCVQCPVGTAKDALPGMTVCQEHREYHADGAARRQLERKEVVFAHYGTTCRCCNREAPLDHLQMDHVAGGGNQHRKQIGNSRLYAWLIENNFPAGFIALCGSCNHAWGHNRACSCAKDRLIPAVVDGVEVMLDPQTGKAARTRRTFAPHATPSPT